ncbi:MAG TPA: TonB-dependent receptor [Bacteroidales bacterium]|nr:TonB-dependent receptor [Bacteroidales bacterium]
MKCFILLSLVGIITVSANSYSQSTKFTFSANNISIQELLSKLEAESDFKFVYDNSRDELKKEVTIVAKNQQVEQILADALSKSGLHYQIIDKYIVITTSEAGSASFFLQRLKISGKVTDTKGSPIPGVNITVKGTTRGTVTDENGFYSIEADKEDAVLVFSFIGYLTEEVPVGIQKEIDVKLIEDVKSLEEVVVVGFGTQKKGSVIGSVDRIETEKLKQPTRTISTSLAGRLAGVFAVQNSGEPGYDGATFWIRGVNTFTGNTNPLVLVDNVERDLDDVDPEEIADFTILKDATATAVYGVRGANGVVLITTKKGTVGAPQIKLTLESGFSDPLELPNFVDGPTYMRLQNEALVNTGKPKLFTDEDIANTASGVDPYYYPNVNWIDELIHHWSSSQRAALNVTGGSERVRYFVSGAYLNQNGMYKKFGGTSYNNNVNVKRYNFRSNVDMNVSKTTTLSVNLAAILEDRNYPGASSNDIFNYILRVPPVWYPARFPDESKVPSYPYSMSGRNPYQLIARSGYSTEYHANVQSNLAASQDLSFITKGLQAKALFSFDTYTEAKVKREITPRPYLIAPYGFDENGNPILVNDKGEYNYVDQEPTNSDYHDYLERTAEAPYNDRSIYAELSLLYNRVFGKHSIGALMLYNQSDKVFPSKSGIYESVPQRHQGLTGRGTYAFDDKYFIEYNFGYNGSENFAKGKRYGFFPSYGIGWVPTREPFMNFIKPVVDYMKIRLSHGIVGNDGLNSRFVYLTRVETTDTNVGFGTNNGYGYGSGKGIDITYYGNPDATWEKAAKTDLGLEMNFLKNFHLQFDFFYEKRTNIWVELSKVPDIFGYGKNPYANEGEMENKGFDGYLDYTGKVGTDFSINLKGTFSYSKNKILKNGEETKQYAYQSSIGQSFNRRMGYLAEGLFVDEAEIKNSPSQTALGGTPKPGDIKYVDYNDDGKIDEFDRVFMGYSNVPEITYGFGSNLMYKNFDFSFLLQGVSRVSFFAKPKAFPEENTGNVLTIVKYSYWNPKTQDLHADFPRLGIGSQSNNYENSSWWLQDGSYLRVKQVELGYSLPTSWTKKVKIGNARIYVNGLNLFTFSQFNWWDPESQSETGLYYPSQKVINMGLEVKF